MLFMCQGRPRPNISLDDRQRALKLYGAWQPPPGITIRGHYLGAHGGDFVILETDSIEALIEATGAWAPFIEYQVTPIVEAQAGVPMLARAEQACAKLLEEVAPRSFADVAAKDRVLA
ncbi:MAG TPA: DUF3303 family protein [Candidatus Binatia bacterium]